ncbi:MAG: carboxypeptidase CpsA [Candidatus Parvarchaeota archaeon]
MDLAQLRKDVEMYNEKVIEIRRTLHQNPELSYQEYETAKLIASHLEKDGIEVRKGVGGTGVVGILYGKNANKTIGLRADMDALPVQEQTGLPFASKKNGVMHACGHDNHVAMLLGAAHVLVQHKDELSNNVKFLFQPAEEDGGEGGALPMIRDGALENPHVDHVFGLHIMSDFPVGTFALRAGAVMAAPDAFKIEVTGKGGHGSLPNHAIDPIYVGNQLISALYGIRSRYVAQTKPLVISVCSVHSGTKDNIIPDNLVMEGTIRTLDEELRKEVKSRVSTMIPQLATALGASAEVSFKENAYPVTYNDPEITKHVIKVLSKIEGMNVVETDPIMGGEDISRFLQKAPGTYYFLGTRNEKKGMIYPNHNSRFTSDEDYLKYGTLSHVLIAMEHW